MKKSILFIFTLILAIFLVACNDTATTNKTAATDSIAVTDKDNSTVPPYDPAMDPIKVEAAFAKVLGDTLNIKMYEVTLKPGDTSLVHTHPDYTLYVLQGGKIAITANGGRQEMDLKAGMGIIFGSVTHSAKNIGNTTIRLLVNDIYRPLGK
ncbi:MAG TPA: cupin domain-containing protein [Chitinophagaceae bacterium]|nr:cupin domain-containing protein [Chitinophagaceae bacterium]